MNGDEFHDPNPNMNTDRRVSHAVWRAVLFIAAALLFFILGDSPEMMAGAGILGGVSALFLAYGGYVAVTDWRAARRR